MTPIIEFTSHIIILELKTLIMIEKQPARFQKYFTTTLLPPLTFFGRNIIFDVIYTLKRPLEIVKKFETIVIWQTILQKLHC